MLLCCVCYLLTILSLLTYLSDATHPGPTTIVLKGGQVRTLHAHDRSTVHLAPLAGAIGVIVVPIPHHDARVGVRVVANVTPRPTAVRNFMEHVRGAKAHFDGLFAHVLLPRDATPVQAAEAQRLCDSLWQDLLVPSLKIRYPPAPPEAQSATVFYPDIIRSHLSEPDAHTRQHEQLARTHARGASRDPRLPPAPPGRSRPGSARHTPASSIGQPSSRSGSASYRAQSSRASPASSDEDQMPPFEPALPGSSIGRQLHLQYGPVPGRDPPEGVATLQWQAQGREFAFHEALRRSHELERPRG